MFAAAGTSGDFLKLPETRRLFRTEQHLPSDLIDRSSSGAADSAGDIFSRARQRVAELVASYKRPALDPVVEENMRAQVETIGERVGLKQLIGIA